MKRTPDAAGLEFLSWLKRFSPALYSHVKSQVGDPPGAGIFALNELNGIGPGAFPGSGLLNFGQIDPWGGVGTPSGSSTVTTGGGGFMDYVNQALETAQAAIPAYFQYEAQRDIVEMNIARANQGLPPIDPGLVAPQIRHIVDVPPGVQTEIMAFKSGAVKFALWGGIALVAFFLLRKVF